jgi:hypothetical protein
MRALRVTARQMRYSTQRQSSRKRVKEAKLTLPEEEAEVMRVEMDSEAVCERSGSTVE